MPVFLRGPSAAPMDNHSLEDTCVFRRSGGMPVAIKFKEAFYPWNDFFI